MSTIKVNKIENTATADGGIAIDATGHVQIDGVQLPTAGALSHRNLIVNGGMTVSQRSTSKTGVDAPGYKTVDRMRYSENSLSTAEITHEQSTDAPDGFSHSLKITVTTAEGSVEAADGFRPLQTRLEGQDLQHLQYGTSGAKSLTLSFYVKSSVTGTYAVAFTRDETTDRLITATYTISSANTWEYKTITIPGDTSASITNDNANRLEVLFHAGAGSNSTSTDTSGSWGNYASTGSAYGNAVNLQNTLNATWQITGVQLEVGEKATPFEHKSFREELNDCLRYFQKSYNYGTDPGTVTDVGMIALRKSSITSSIYDINLLYAHKRVNPTIVIYSPGSGASGKAEVDTADETAQGSDIGENNARVTGTSQGDGLYIRVHYTADAEL